jgi:hypothetical protein
MYIAWSAILHEQSIIFQTGRPTLAQSGPARHYVDPMTFFGPSPRPDLALYRGSWGAPNAAGALATVEGEG